MQKITTFLTFQDRGEEAVNFYVSTFPNSKINSLVVNQFDGPMPKGALLHASFELDGKPFMAMEGGPHFKFDQGFSLFVNCETQEEVDHLWETLSEGGEIQPCGWLKDRYGVSWQIIPSILGQLMQDKDAKKSQRVINAMLKMGKIDIQGLQDAYEGR